MPTEYISIQEASEVSQKSIQTIRRAIKAKKLSAKKSKTPQGFNYLIEKESLYSFYKIKGDVKPAAQTQEIPTESKKISKHKGGAITKNDIQEFTMVMERLMNQHADERQNFLRLINTLQEKIFFLENQMNLLKAPEKRWYHFWR
jgi:site-specific DNA-cytosine methylase